MQHQDSSFKISRQSLLGTLPLAKACLHGRILIAAVVSRCYMTLIQALVQRGYLRANVAIQNDEYHRSHIVQKLLLEELRNCLCEPCLVYALLVEQVQFARPFLAQTQFLGTLTEQLTKPAAEVGAGRGDAPFPTAHISGGGPQVVGYFQLCPAAA